MAALTEEIKLKIESLIIEQGLLAKEELEKYRKEAQNLSEPLFAYLMAQQALDEEDLTRLMAKVHDVQYIDLREFEVKPEVLKLLSEDVAKRFMAIPLGEMDDKLVVAMLDASNIQAVDFLSNKIGRTLKVYMASESSIHSALNQYDVDLEGGVSGVVAHADGENVVGKKSSSIKKIKQDSPVSKALSAILEYAVKNKASDIHAEPFENEFKIRVRVDGVLREIMKLPKSIEPAFISRVKILANLKIDEHRIPQDGQFDIDVLGKDIDLRIAISPVIWGEQVIIRLLDKSGLTFDLEEMGYKGRALRVLQKAISRPNGMILTSGPTGSGKSTSLYTLIREIRDESINIITLEDPVEYKMDGVNQIQVNERVGLSFANGLRSILRQDPDVVMVGEMRDHETAKLGVQAALTGHLVFSTLHTNSASGVLPRLLEMEIEPYLIASTVNAVIGQRLVRRLTKETETYASSPAETEAIKAAFASLIKQGTSLEDLREDFGYEVVPDMNAESFTLYRGVESADAPGGYQGRVGIYEVIQMTDQIEQLILNESTSSQIERQAIKEGLITMRQDGYLKALNGITTIDEVNRVTVAGGDDNEIVYNKEDDINKQQNEGGGEGGQPAAEQPAS